MADTVPLLFNPRAGGGKGAAKVEQARGLLAKAGVPTHVVPTTEPGAARILSRRLAEEGHDRLLVLGGDGTLSEATDGVLASGRPTVLGFLPAGRGNDFLRDFAIRTLEDAVDRIAAGTPRRLDAVRLTHTGGQVHSINVAGVGYMAQVADLANRRLTWLGAKAYTAAAVPELVRFQAPWTRIELDGRLVEDHFSMVAVCNTRYTGGAMRIAPVAEPDDGLADVLALRRVGRLGLVRLLTKVFSGAHMGHERVLYEQARQVRVEPERPSPLLVDGEVFGSTPVTYDCLPGAFEALV